MASDERLYFVVYDIADQKRWRGVFRTMHGYGEWVQLSVFQCRLSRLRHAELIADLDLLIHHDEDHVVVIDLGPADQVEPKVVSLGKKSYQPVDRSPLVV
jgi:CRISPR-associated protein Cas2